MAVYTKISKVELNNFIKNYEMGKITKLLHDKWSEKVGLNIHNQIKEFTIEVDNLNKVQPTIVFDLVVLLQPTSPLRTTKNIDAAIEHYLKKKQRSSDTLVSVNRVDSKCLLTFGIEKDSGNIYSHFGGVDLINPERQNLPNCYAPNGSIFIAPVYNFCGFYSEHKIPFIMDKDMSVDIDCADDLTIAEGMLSGREY